MPIREPHVITNIKNFPILQMDRLNHCTSFLTESAMLNGRSHIRAILRFC